MIGASLTVTVAGRDLSATLKASDIVAFEREYNVPWQQLTSPQGREEWELWVAWRALAREEKYSSDFPTFLADLDGSVRVAAPAKAGDSPLAPPPLPDS